MSEDDPSKTSENLTEDNSKEQQEPLDGSDKTEKNAANIAKKVEAEIDAAKPLIEALKKVNKNNDITYLSLAEEIIYQKQISKEDKQVTTKVLITIHFNKLSKNVYLSANLLGNLYSLITQYKEYFDDLGDKSWYKTIADIIFTILEVKDLEKYVTKPYERIPKYLELIEKINKVYPLEDLEEKKKKLIEIASKSLETNIDKTFYDDDVEESQKSVIRNSAKTLDITIPTEQEILERDINKDVASISDKLDKINKSLQSEKIVYDELPKAQKHLDDLITLLREAETKFPELNLPEGFTNVDELIIAFESKIKDSQNKNSEIITKEKLSFLTEALESEDINKIRYAISSLEKLSDTDIKPDIVLKKLQEFKKKIIGEINNMSVEIQGDVTKALKLGEKLTNNGSVLNALEEAIQKYTEK